MKNVKKIILNNNALVVNNYYVMSVIKIYIIKEKELVIKERNYVENFKFMKRSYKYIFFKNY